MNEEQRENLCDIKELISVIKSGKEKHEKRTGEMICVDVTYTTGKYNSVLYLEVRNYTTNMCCKRGIPLDEFINSEDPRSVLIYIFGNTMRETTDWYVCNEEVCNGVEKKAETKESSK